jgi:hypothetical protein
MIYSYCLGFTCFARSILSLRRSPVFSQDALRIVNARMRYFVGASATAGRAELRARELRLILIATLFANLGY